MSARKKVIVLTPDLERLLNYVRGAAESEEIARKSPHFEHAEFMHRYDQTNRAIRAFTSIVLAAKVEEAEDVDTIVEAARVDSIVEAARAETRKAERSSIIRRLAARADQHDSDNGHKRPSDDAVAEALYAFARQLEAEGGDKAEPATASAPSAMTPLEFERQRAALVAAGKLAIAATWLLRGKDDKTKVEGFAALPGAIDNYDRAVIALMYAPVES